MVARKSEGKQPKSPPVERKIQFFRITQEADGFAPFEIDSTVKALKKFKGEDAEMRHWKTGDRFFPEFFKKGGNQAIRFSSSRLRALPRKEKERKLSRMPLADDEGVAESTHMVFFEPNIVGVEWNSKGPRISQFVQFLNYKFPEWGVFKAKACLNPDFVQKLRDLEEINLFQITVTRSNFELLETSAPSLYEIAENIFSVSDSFSVTLRLTDSDRKQDLFGLWAKKNVTDIAELADGAKEFATAKTRGMIDYGDGLHSETMPIFNDKISHVIKTVEEDEDRGISTTDIVNRIIEAYNTREEEIERSSGMDIHKHKK